MNKIEYTYRGSLKSCNYSCYYCPFSKVKINLEELEKDRKELINFFQNLEKKHKKNIFITPYGEALIHKYYQEEIERNIVREDIENIGIQTNLSLDVVSWIKSMKDRELPVKKINLWITCHFSQIDYEKFLEKIEKIYEDINLSVGVVGIPTDYNKIFKLRDDLPKDVYLWINEYSNLKEKYSDELIKKFQEIDPIFFRKNEINFLENCSCGEINFFVEGNGKVKLCNRNPKILGDFYKENYYMKKDCSKKNCDCYLSFSKFNSNIFNFFGDKKLYRIPNKIEVTDIFFDIDGTLVQNGKISEKILETIKLLYEKKYNLYFITDLPKEIALKKCSKIKKYFKGGIFDCGAHISVENLESFEIITADLSLLKDIEIKNKIIKIFTHNENPYKILLKPIKIDIPKTTLYKGIPNILVKEGVNKFSALDKLKKKLGLDLDKVLVVGNDTNDIVLFENIKNSICVFSGNSKAKDKSEYVLNINQISYILK